MAHRILHSVNLFSTKCVFVFFSCTVLADVHSSVIEQFPIPVSHEQSLVPAGCESWWNPCITLQCPIANIASSNHCSPILSSMMCHRFRHTRYLHGAKLATHLPTHPAVPDTPLPLISPLAALSKSPFVTWSATLHQLGTLSICSSLVP